MVSLISCLVLFSWTISEFDFRDECIKILNDGL